MIEWKLTAVGRKDNEEITLDLLSSSKNYSLRETDYIQFSVCIDNSTYIEYGDPYILIGDVPLELEFKNLSENNRVYESNELLGNPSSSYFYNFFGESEIGLSFEQNPNYIATCTVNILARAENALLASEMLSHLTDNLEDAVAVCFSRSKITGGHDHLETFQFTRLDIIEKTISFLFECLPLFAKENKHSWVTQTKLSERGQPTGPDSVYWALTHLDRLSPSSPEEANLIFNNRSYKLDSLPKESIVKEFDVFENRVIHTFLHNISLFLVELRETFTLSSQTNQNYLESEYVRFDHTMTRFAQLALKHKAQYIENLTASVEQIKKAFKARLPARVVPGLQPRMTSYVAKHIHYRNTFNLIEQCYAAPAPTFEGVNFLFGLKNLAIVYELSSLLLLNEAIIDCFGVKVVEQSYRKHDPSFPFGGNESERPYGTVNNFFGYRSETFDIELLYEPKIYPYSSASNIGDLVDTSDTRATAGYGKHYYCPDFVLKIRSKNWRKPVTIILDSKYKDSTTVRKYDIVQLTQKYLLNIHQVNNAGTLGISPIKLLLILFAHGKNGNQVRTVATRHTLTGNLPVLPQSAAIFVR